MCYTIPQMGNGREAPQYRGGNSLSEDQVRAKELWEQERLALRQAKAERVILEEVKGQPSQLAHNKDEINQHTLAYYGEFDPSMFRLLQKYKIEHVYSWYTNAKLEFLNIAYGAITPKDIEIKLERERVQTSPEARQLLRNERFKNNAEHKVIRLVKFKVSDLGLWLNHPAHIGDVFYVAEMLGLEKCPAEIGAHLRRVYKNQQRGEELIIGMEPISVIPTNDMTMRSKSWDPNSGSWVEDINKFVLRLESKEGVLRLSTHYANLSQHGDKEECHQSDYFVFALPV